MNEINFNIEDIEKINLSMDVGVKEIYPPIDNLEVTPTKEEQIFTHEGSYGYDEVKVKPIPDEYIIPEGTLPITENATYDVTNYARVSASVHPAPYLQDKEVTPNKEIQNITFDENYDGLNEVQVNAIPNEYIIPSGTININSNGVHNVNEYENVDVNVEFTPNLQDKTVTPTKETQTITSDEDYDGLDEVTINPIPENYIEPTGTLEITNNGETDVTSYSKVNVNVEGTGGSGKYAPRYISFYSYAGTSLDDELANLDTSNLTSMSNMFYTCVYLPSLDLEQYNFNTSNVTSMSYMFYAMQSATNIKFSNFDTSNVTTIESMFNQCKKLAGDVNLSNLFSEVKNASKCFQNAVVTGRIICPTLYKVTDLSFFASSNTGVTGIDLSNAGRDASGITTCASLCLNSTALTEITLTNMNVTKCKTFASMFSGATELQTINGLSTLTNSVATSLNSMFDKCTKLTSLDLSGFTTTNVTNMGNIFRNCTSLMYLDIRNFDFTKVSTYTNMFTGIPINCEIIVADDTARNWVKEKRSDLSNIKTVAEL